MSKILFCIPYETMIPYAKAVLSPQYSNIEISLTNPREAVQLVQNAVSRGVKIVAARAVTAEAIRQAQLDVAVVIIPITGFDIIRALNEAKTQGKRIAVIAKTKMVLGIDFLAKELGLEFRHYDMDYYPDYEKAVLKAVADGAQVVLGGALTVEAATRRGIPCSLIKIGSESLLQAAQEATHIQAALETETAKRKFFSAILNHSRDGVITVDKDCHISEINPAAQRLVFAARDVLGEPIEKLLPEIKLDKYSVKKNTPHSLISVKGIKLMYNSVPIVVNGNLFGFVITLHEISKIQQMEAIIRKEIYASGHYAKHTFTDIAGMEPKIKKAVETAKDYAATDSNVLILGESGTGKELFAQSIHNGSKRAKEPFVVINCAALPSQILESEMFGYVGGAFTGANKEGKPGLFEVAHGGTVFLDEVTEMDYANQGRLLRVLQEKTVVRLGSYKVTPVDVRIVAATNKDLETLVQQNIFRLDLFYRLNVLRLNIPPLRERKTDIALYAELFLREFAASSGKTFKLSSDAAQYLQNYPWLGNIRELRNLMERIAVIAKTEVITGMMLGETLTPTAVPRKKQPAKEKRLTQEIKKALEENGGNYTRAAKALGINRSTLWRRMQRLKIEY